jgi:hypothetical protein
MMEDTSAASTGNGRDEEPDLTASAAAPDPNKKDSGSFTMLVPRRQIVIVTGLKASQSQAQYYISRFELCPRNIDQRGQQSLAALVRVLPTRIENFFRENSSPKG